MIDLQVCFPSCSIPLSSAILQPAQPGQPQTVLVTGQDFRYVAGVLINGIDALYTVLNQTQLLATVPPLAGQLADIAVTSAQLNLTPESVLSFKIGPTATKVSGMLRLVQRFLLILLREPGRDIFSPKLGGFALKNVGASFGPQQQKTIVTDFVLAVRTTVQTILKQQRVSRAVPSTELLLSAAVTSANYSEADCSFTTSIAITNQSGQTALANLLV